MTSWFVFQNPVTYYDDSTTGESAYHLLACFTCVCAWLGESNKHWLTKHTLQFSCNGCINFLFALFIALFHLPIKFLLVQALLHTSFHTLINFFVSCIHSPLYYVRLITQIMTIATLLLIAFQYNRISELKTYELETSEVLMVCQQLVLRAFRYSYLNETTNGLKEGKISLHHQD